MHLTIHQSFYIHTIRVNAITNSSVLQIGSTGSIQALSEAYNTGGFTQPAEKLTNKQPIHFTPTVPLGGIGK
ncbi:spore germination protein GerPB [Virgibacillus sp. 179-BFC.A HS]|uniref:Spore germination protein GerPB n=1 Tax=Tigheibacillus jepli TaxID=3035914 RepID=A0ABU5CJ03_9BACI|nr:spore germination protein GerPB [Virgibacillus sp. 179-BFC.A HS]MDY0406205.1 spore germination protein GerPB [Virgibacillus sp. 179-BFC.A HS]